MTSNISKDKGNQLIPARIKVTSNVSKPETDSNKQVNQQGHQAK
jgi:hypothetical protein